MKPSSSTGNVFIELWVLLSFLFRIQFFENDLTILNARFSFHAFFGQLTLLFQSSVAWEMMKYADMHSKGISLIYKYEEGNDVDFDIGLYFYEQLCKFCDDPKNQHLKEKYKRSIPEMMTALRRKQVHETAFACLFVCLFVDLLICFSTTNTMTSFFKMFIRLCWSYHIVLCE